MARDPVPEGIDCALSHYGCCPDGHTAAQGPHDEGCPTIDCTVAVFFALSCRKLCSQSVVIYSGAAEPIRATFKSGTEKHRFSVPL